MASPGMDGQGQGTGGTQSRKAKLDQPCRELRDLVTLQEQGMRIFSQPREEKLRQNRKLLPSRQRVLQEDTRVLDFVPKYDKLPVDDAFAEGQAIAVTTENLEVTQKRLETIIHGQVKVCDMLLHQVKQWTQVRDERQRYLQQLQEAEMDDKMQQPQLQRIRQLENDIEKMLMKVHAGQRVTNLYLKVRDILKNELFYLPRYLDLLCGMTVMNNEELTARQNLKAADVIKKFKAEAKQQVLMERSLRVQNLAEQRAQIKSLQQKTERERQLREQAASMLPADQSQSSSNVPVGAGVEATVTRMEHEALVNDKMEKAKAALQSCCLWDIPSSLLAQLTLEDLEEHIKESKEKERVLSQTLKELELKQAKLKSHQPLNTARQREEDLRANLQREEARREQMRAQMMRNQEQLIQFENSIDNLFVRLHGIVIPGQEETAKAMGMEEKLQQCEKKLQYLKQRVLACPPEAQSYDGSSKTLEKVRNLLEETIASETQNLKVSFEDVDSTVHDSLDFEEEEDNDYVPSRADIKKQGLHLIKINSKCTKRK